MEIGRERAEARLKTSTFRLTASACSVPAADSWRMWTDPPRPPSLPWGAYLLSAASCPSGDLSDLYLHLGIPLAAPTHLTPSEIP